MDTYIPDTDSSSDDDKSGLLAYLSRSGRSDNPDVGNSNDPNATTAPVPPNVNDGSSQPRIAAPAGPSVPTPTYASKAPVYTAPDDDMLQALQAKRTTDSAPIDAKANAPKWYERLGGGLTAAAMAFGHEPGALEAGTAITNQRANQANANRQGAIDQDNTAIGDFKDQADRASKQYETQLQGYNAGLSGARVDQEATNAANTKANEDRTFTRESANDTFNHKNSDRMYQRDTTNDKFDQDYKNRDLNSRNANEAAGRRIEGGRLSVEKQRLKDEEDGTDPKSQRGQAKLQTQISQKYGDLVDKLENGDPKGASEEEVAGFKSTYRKAQNSPTSLDSGQPWKPGEKEAYLDELKQSNADRKNGFAARQRDELANAGRNVPLIQYDKEGQVIGGQPQQAAPPPQQQQPAAPPAAPQQAAATPPQQQQAPQTAKVKAGTLKVGDPVVYNGKTGTVTGINAQGKPIVQWGK